MTSDQPMNWTDKLELLHEAAITVAGAHSVEQALQRIADSARELIDAEMAAIGVPGEKGTPMAHFVVSGVDDETMRQAGHPPMGRGVLGVLLSKGHALRMRDVREHEAYEGVPSKHPQVRSFLGVPVRSSGDIVGDLYLANKITADEFTEEDNQLAQMLAAHAAAVIRTLSYHQKQEELAAIRARAELAPKIQDDVLQTLFGAGLLLKGITVDDAGQQTQLEEIQTRLDSAILNLRDHLEQMTSPTSSTNGTVTYVSFNGHG